MNIGTGDSYVMTFGALESGDVFSHRYNEETVFIKTGDYRNLKNMSSINAVSIKSGLGDYFSDNTQVMYYPSARIRL